MALNTRSFHSKGSFHSIVLLCVLALIGSSCSPAQQSPPSEEIPSANPSCKEPLARVVMIIHGNLKTSAFWPDVAQGAVESAYDNCIHLEVNDLENSDYDKMSGLIVDAAASKPDGVIISLPNVTKLQPAIKKLEENNIPFVVINAGSEDAKNMGALAFVGQKDEYNAGYKAGEQMAEAGVRHAYCINLQPQNKTSTQRCEGFIDAIKSKGGSAQVLVVERSDPGAADRIKLALELAPETDGIFATAELPIIQDAIKDMGMQDTTSFAYFDFSPKSYDAIQYENMLFAAGQGPYKQGYCAISILSSYFVTPDATYKEVITGPVFITRENYQDTQTGGDCK